MCFGVVVIGLCVNKVLKVLWIVVMLIRCWLLGCI